MATRAHYEAARSLSFAPCGIASNARFHRRSHSCGGKRLSMRVRDVVGKVVPYGQKDVSWFNRTVRDRSGVTFSAHACRYTLGFNYMARGGNRRAPGAHGP